MKTYKTFKKEIETEASLPAKKTPKWTKPLSSTLSRKGISKTRKDVRSVPIRKVTAIVGVKG